MTERVRARAIWLLAGSLLRVLAPPADAGAQIVDARWSALTRLSATDRRTAAATMVPDPFGFLHALWIQSQDAHDTGMVAYARFDGTAWSDPVAIASLRDADSNHRTVAGAVDRHGVLHVVWNSGISGPTRYAQAFVGDATAPRSWTSPRWLDLAAYRLDLQVDAGGVLHLLFSRFYDDPRGIYYVRSTDGGDHWSTPVKLDPDIPPGYAPFFIALRLDDAGGVHALWHYYVPDTARGKSIHYAHSRDGGLTWPAAIALATPDASGEDLWKANPSLAVSGDQVHVVWAGGAANSTFRVHRFSTDRGEHWGPPARIFGDLVGEANGDGMAVDASGRVHWVGQVRYPQAVYHACWDHDHWTGPEPVYLIAATPFEPIGDRIHAHNVRLGIRAGRQLAMSFTSIPEHEASPPVTVLYGSQRTLDDVPEASEPLPPPPARRISPEMWGLIAIVLLAVTSTLHQLRQRRGVSAG